MYDMKLVITLEDFYLIRDNAASFSIRTRVDESNKSFLSQKIR